MNCAPIMSFLIHSIKSDAEPCAIVAMVECTMKSLLLLRVKIKIVGTLTYNINGNRLFIQELSKTCAEHTV